LSESDRSRRSDPARFCQRLLEKQGLRRVFAEMTSGEHILSQRALNIGPLWKEVLPVTLISLLAGAVKRAARADCPHSHIKTCQRRQIWTLTTPNSPAGCFGRPAIQLPCLGGKSSRLAEPARVSVGQRQSARDLSTVSNATHHRMRLFEQQCESAGMLH
jgi:hypothetical protein